VRYSGRIRESVQKLAPLQAERRLRNRLDAQSLRLLDELLADGDPGVLSTLRGRLGEYDVMLLNRLLESVTAKPRKEEDR